MPSKKPKKIPTDLDNKIKDTVLNQGKALAVIDGRRMFVESIKSGADLFEFYISKSQLMFNLLSSVSCLFSMTGISFKISRRIVKYVEKIANDSKNEIFTYFSKFTQGAYEIHLGDLHFEFYETVVHSALKAGDLFVASAYILFSGWFYIERGNFKTVDKVIMRLDEIDNCYNDDHAKADAFDLRANLLIKKHETNNAEKNNNSALALMENLNQEARKIEFLGLKLQIEVLKSDYKAGKRILVEAKVLIQKIGRSAILPMFFSLYAIGAACYYVAIMEKSNTAGNKADVTRYRKAALKAGKDAVKTGNKFAPICVEAYRFMAIYYWLINKQKKALKWFDKTIKEGERMRARPELSRTYFEVGKRLLEPKSKYKQLNGITAEEYLEKARILFEEMDLKWDLEQLEKVKETIED